MELLSKEQAQRRLQAYITAAGTLTAFCNLHKLSAGNVSRMANGLQPISQEVGEIIRLKPTLRYFEMGTKKSPEQEQYENDRASYARGNGRDMTPMKGPRG